MAKAKKELEDKLDEIVKKISALNKVFDGIKNNMMDLQKQVHTRRDNKKIVDLKNKIASL